MPNWRPAFFSLSLCFSGHFPGGPGLAEPECLHSDVSILDFIRAKGDGGGGDNSTGSIRRAKLQSDDHQQPNTQFSTGQLPFLSPSQQCQSAAAEDLQCYT